MTYAELTVLIPSHGLEDFPTDLGETEAAELLNAFAVLWHPALLATTNSLPGWERADEPPEELENRLVVIPADCTDWLPAGWEERARDEGAIVLSGLSDRSEMARAALEPLDSEHEVAPDLVADFFALGTCFLQLELMTRYMHHFSNLDEVHLQREVVSAAKSALARDETAARAHLGHCFEVLTEARERFYPVDCYLVDLCLLIPELADEHLDRTLAAGPPVNVLACAADLAQIAEENPERFDVLKEARTAGRAELLGGEWSERPSLLLPVESLLWDVRRGQRAYRQLLDRGPTTWARRRYGLSPLMPMLLSRSGLNSALHVALDDGIYPDTEYSKIRWEGCDGTVVDALTRLPLPADSATSFLRFATRMAESMEQDQVAAVVLARWPEIMTPWLEDLQRIHKYAPVLGRFVTFEEFFQQTDDPGRLLRFQAREYLSPTFIQSVAREERDPISRFADQTLRRHRFDAGNWYRSAAQLLTGRSPTDDGHTEDERLIEEAGPEADPEATERADRFLAEFVPRSARRLAEIVMGRAGNQPGVLLLNPLSFSRRVPVELPSLDRPPAVGGPVKAVQFDESRRMALVEVPGAGFAWISGGASGGTSERTPVVRTAEENLLRNEFLEVHVNEETGGIAQIKEYGRRPNRLSQQLAFRFPFERRVQLGAGDDAEWIKTWYSRMRCRSSEVTCDGPALGEIVTTGDLVDPTDGTRLAAYRQTIRLWRARPVVELDLELDDVGRLPEGDPWSNYYAVRFAWNDSTASLTRSLQQGAHGFQGQRIEAPHYFEIADDKERTTILPCGLPYHRKTGPRMLDSILIAGDETRRTFRFMIAVDADYPMQAALEAMVPVTAVPTEAGPPHVGNSGWFFHLNAKNVQLTRIVAPAAPASPGEEQPPSDEGEGPREGQRFVARLVETEGRPRRVRLRCYRRPAAARQCDFQGRTITQLDVEEDCVLVQMTAYEIADVEVAFGE